MSSLAVILARGGSKRIPKKNIRDFLGLPLLGYPLKSAINSGRFDEIIVSTDSSEIADVAISLGAKVPFLRSPENSNDFSTTLDALKEVFSSYEKIGKKFELMCCLYPAAVMINEEDLKISMDMFIRSDCSVLSTVVPFSYPPQRALRLNEESRAIFLDPKNCNKRTQDIPELFHDAGQFYWFKTSSLMEKKSVWEGDVLAYKLDPLSAQDIDNEFDWKLAEMKYMLRQKALKESHGK